MGTGQVQEQAISELNALRGDNPLRTKAIDLLVGLKSTLELKQKIKNEDRELIMRLSAAYEQKIAEAKLEAVQTERTAIIENLLKARFGSLDEELRAIVEPLSKLSPEEFTPLLLQLSREEMLTPEVNKNIANQDRELIMRLKAAYEQKLASVKQEIVQTERRATIENLLQARFGSLDEELRAIIEPLLELSSEEFTPLLLQLSREEILARFG